MGNLVSCALEKCLFSLGIGFISIRAVYYGDIQQPIQASFTFNSGFGPYLNAFSLLNKLLYYHTDRP
jgi:hypothetical protein